jgi:hypothetical protein
MFGLSIAVIVASEPTGRCMSALFHLSVFPCIVDVKARVMLQAARSRVRDPMKRISYFSIYLIVPASLGPGLYSASNRHEYQKQKNISGE